MLKHTTPGERARQEGRPNLRQLVFDDPDWVLVDFDDVASLYVFRDALRRVKTREKEGRPWSFDPDSWRPRAPDTPWAVLRDDLESHAQDHPTEIRSSLILAQLGTQVGDTATVADAVKRVVTRKPDGAEARYAMDLLRGVSSGR